MTPLPRLRETLRFVKNAMSFQLEKYRIAFKEKMYEKNLLEQEVPASSLFLKFKI